MYDSDNTDNWLPPLEALYPFFNLEVSGLKFHKHIKHDKLLLYINYVQLYLLLIFSHQSWPNFVGPTDMSNRFWRGPINP